MVSQFPMQSFSQPSSLTLDTHHAQQNFFKEEDANGPEDSVLENSTVDSSLELSPPVASSRRESFALGTTIFSPKTEDWQSVDMQSVPSNNPYMDQNSADGAASHNAFLQNQGQVFGYQANAWGMTNAAGSDTAIQQFAAVPTPFDGGQTMFQRPLQNQNPFHPGNMFASLGHGEQSMPTSPQREWVLSSQNMNKKMRPESPAIRSHNDLRRGDGIRKKNARFEIPAERNLSNIDHLIAQSTDEQEIKELKQQKRLLRNRQAALDSRQRKKQHTERLEDEKKHFTTIISDMEEDVTVLKDKMDQLLLEKQQYADYIESLRIEKDEMIRTHTLETGELRKKVDVLTQHVQRLENQSVASSAGPGFNGAFADDFDDMSGIHMPGNWDSPSFLNDYAVEGNTKPQSSSVPKRSDGTLLTEGDKPAAQGGLLFMLFLVGAFVMSSRSVPAIPRVSEDVRAASATILDSVLKDAGINSQSAGMQSIAPQPSGTGWAQPPTTASNVHDVSMDGTAPSMLDALTQPTEEQLHEQIFSISPAQYNGVNNHDFLQNAPERSTSQGRKNLAEALAAMRVANKETGAAEVYTRSLLWDQIPNDVVRNFAKMVAQCNPQNAQQCNESQ